jgi:hypothetical protein
MHTEGSYEFNYIETTKAFYHTRINAYKNKNTSK